MEFQVQVVIALNKEKESNLMHLDTDKTEVIPVNGLKLIKPMQEWNDKNDKKIINFIHKHCN